MNIRFLAAIFVLAASSVAAAENHPDCAGVRQWATRMAFVHLKNSRLMDNDLVDFTKTKTERLASEKIGKDLYRQVHHVVFTEKSGKTIEVITSNDASNAECSMSGVRVFVVSQEIGD